MGLNPFFIRARIQRQSMVSIKLSDSLNPFFIRARIQSMLKFENEIMGES